MPGGARVVDVSAMFPDHPYVTADVRDSDFVELVFGPSRRHREADVQPIRIKLSAVYQALEDMRKAKISLAADSGPEP